MAIQIKYFPDGAPVQTLKTLSSEDFSIVPDDRLEQVQLINGVYITDGGRYTDGDKYLVTVMVDSSMWQRIKTWWAAREVLDVIFEDGFVLTECIMIVKSIVYADKLHPGYKRLQLEFWKDTDFAGSEPE